VITQVAEGVYVEPSKERLAAFLRDQWLPGIQASVRPLTHDNYSKVVERYVRRRDIGSVPLRSLSPAHLNALYAELANDGLAPGTRRLVHATLSRALGDARRWGRIARNPASDATPPARPKGTATAWTARELRTFLAHVEDDRLFALWRLASTTGMRRGELLAVTWRALDLDGARLQIDRQLLPTMEYGPPKSQSRTISLDAGTVAALRRHRECQRLERDLAGDAYEDGDLCFCDELGRPYKPKWLTKRFSTLRTSAGVPTGHLHTLRHTHITHALTAGVPLHIVAARVGDSPTTVLNTYSHLLPHSDEQAAEAVASILADKALTNAAI
jgi:integrase